MIKLAFLGFGNVGQGLARILVNKGNYLKEKFGFEYKVVAIATRSKGSVCCPGSSIDLRNVLKTIDDGGSINDLTGASEWLSAEDIIETSGAEVLLELSYTDLKTGQPAIGYVEKALQKGMHVITANKGPAALAMKRLQKLAEFKGVKFLAEGSVMAGTPVINLAESNLAGNSFRGFRGILNGTSNYILTRMKEGLSYDVALKEAQDLGYAEADPTADVEGFDAGAKGVILANLLMDADIGMEDLELQGISHLSNDDIKAAADNGHCWKVLVQAEKQDAQVKVSVGPVKLPQSDPLSSVNGATNAITFDTDIMGDVTIIGAGAGREETGFAVLSDLLQLVKYQPGQ